MAFVLDGNVLNISILGNQRDEPAFSYGVKPYRCWRVTPITKERFKQG